MESLLFFFLENMALIIALMYLALKAKELFFKDMNEPAELMVYTGIFIGFLTFSVMYNPYVYEEMRLDLREVPLYFISFLGGWKFGVLSTVIPIGYRTYLGGPTMAVGIFQSIILPVLIGSLFHDRKMVDKLFVPLNFKKMIAGFVLFELIKSVWMLVSTPADLLIAASIFFFATLAVLAMGLIVNEENRIQLLRKELEMLSNEDPMTRLPNIRHFRNKLQYFTDKEIPIAIVMMDVDFFKVYNDTHGHQKGDEVLRSIGQIMKDSVNRDDFIARYGGEEFIMCFTSPVNAEQARMMAEKVRKAIENYHFEGQELQPEGNLTVSMGLSFSYGKRGLKTLIDEADKALYHSKKLGKNRVSLFESSTLEEQAEVNI